MAKNFILTIVAPQRLLFEGEVSYVQVPGGAGSFGVLADHAPIVATLEPGKFELRRADGQTTSFTTKKTGLFEFHANLASILLDTTDAAAI